ncbi:helix-turn-helix transcriptional regulator [Hamadaea tsunoensis]|uniref:helix-turn-helix transcriptional regulator n=1 Tax=Hamadaea tsunoensis TaxID=53368 RepID=UPI00040AFFF1|nr:helix-turn-helix transcriptional regulator [Hamadaea tsunoensis]
MGTTATKLQIGRPIPQLSRYGLTVDADLVYRTLATFGRATVRQLSKDLGMPAARVLSALESLGDLGAACEESSNDRGSHWAASPPDRVIGLLSERRLLRLRARTPAPVPFEPPRELGPGLRHLPNRPAVRERLITLVGATRSEFFGMHPETQFSATAVSAAARTDQALLSRKLQLRSLGVQNLPTAEQPLDPVASNSYRNAAELPMKLLVFDRRIALFPVDPSDYDRGYLEVAQRPIVESLVQLFRRHWTAAHDPEADMPAISLTPREQALIALLVAGHTDASAARELHISVRTVTAVMRSLMDRVQVDNRFQLGVALGALQVVTPPSRHRPDSSPQEGNLR